MKKTVLLAMSGGVDSTYAALKLIEDGYDVTGITFTTKYFDNEFINDVNDLIKKLNIKHKFIDISKEFNKEVIQNFIQGYKDGITPNPCVVCNKKIKFELLNEIRKEMNIDYLATGHYLRIVNCKGLNLLKKAKNEKKDQTYFLNQINPKTLDICLFPLGDVNDKEEVRNYLKNKQIEIFNKKESQEICFIKKKTSEYLTEYIPKNEGIIKDVTEKVLGKHDGSHLYTIGQRKGLGITTLKPMYVVNKDKNTIYVGEEKLLYTNKVIINNVNIFCEEFLKEELKGKVRYSSTEKNIKNIKKNTDETYEIFFESAQRAVTKGQYCAIYYKDILVLGGIIV